MIKRATELCILCKTSERELLIEKDSWKVYRCPGCGLGFLDPRHSESEIEQLYRSEYFSERYDEGIDPDSARYKKRLSRETHRTKFIKHVKCSGRLLDIGCGYGYFLDACRRQGYDVQGLDVSKWAAGYAIQKLGISVTVGKINDVSFPLHHFDIITMWHSLEHTPDPHLALRKARSWLKPDGILVIDVPNYEGTNAQKIWQEWDGWSLPYHYWHFTFKSLTLLLQKHDFKIMKSKNYHSDFVKEKLRRIPVVSLFARLIAKMYSGTSVAVISKVEN
ncbi:MAG: class I SAM-dependent methyltransferase [Thermodesulfobacteriota bacterium]|nr:class I SAM-dependent methyltransferase [Thermodesulfobacteriota bacterium]